MNATLPNRLRTYLPAGTIVAVFALVAVFINPLREGATQDDWAYALSVRNLLQTGANTPYAWFPTHFPMHTYWGGLFSLVFGYSFASLRISTAALMLIGLAAFYFLALECGIGEWPAALLSIVLLANPLVALLAFTYMSDVPLMAWLIVALALYARGLRLGSLPLMVAGSAAAAAATLTRFNAWAFLLGLLVVWLLDKERRQRWHLYAGGASLTAIAGLYMLNRMVFQPAGDTDVSLEAQARYLRQVGDLALNANWRVVGILETVALFALPLLFLVVLDAITSITRRRTERPEGRFPPLAVWLVAGCLVYVAGTMAYGYWGQSNPVTVPLLPGDVSLYRLLRDAITPLSIIAAVGAVVTGAVFAWRYASPTGWRELPAGEQLIDLVTLFLLGSILLLFKIFDRYVLIVWPYTVLVVGRYLWGRWGNRRMWALAVPFLIVMLGVNSLWARWFLARNEAQWNASQRLVESGVSPDEIASYWEWNSYHGAYETYMAERKHRLPNYSEYILKWLPTHLLEAEYFVSPQIANQDMSQWTVIETVEYDHWGFADRPIYVLRRGGP